MSLVGVETEPLLGTRLTVPRFSAPIVIRQRLLELLSRAVRKPLTVLSAPAGSGKTVCLSSWLASDRRPPRVAWLSLQSSDSQTIWRYLVEALRRGSAGDGTAPDWSDLGAWSETALARLVNRLASLATPLVLVLDDVQEVSQTEAFVVIDALVRNAPSQLRIVISSRSDPLLPLHRFRLSDHMTDIRLAELAFRREEARELFDRHDVAISEHDLDLLLAKTEGWAAGLRLTALSLTGRPDSGRFIDDFAGADRSVADYLVEEVLHRQSDAVQQFLLQTSILDELSGPAADAVTGRNDGEQLLDRLARSNIFVTEAGGVSRHYRYHQLFAELLRHKLIHEALYDVPELHLRAAVWHSEKGLAVPAIQHALAAGDWEYATGLIVDPRFTPILCGERRDAVVIRNLFARLPANLLTTDPVVDLAVQISRTDIPIVPDVNPHVLRAERALPSLPEGKRRELAALILILRLTHSRLIGDLEALVGDAEKLCALATQWEQAKAPRHEGYRALALWNLGTAQLWMVDPRAAQASLSEALRLATAAHLEYVQVWCQSQLALLSAESGWLSASRWQAQAALGLADRLGWSGQSCTVPAHLALAWVCYRRDDIRAANRHHQQAQACLWLDDTLGVDEPHVHLAAAVLRANLLTAEGQWAGARRALVARSEIAPWRPPPGLQVWTTVNDAELLTADSNPAEALSLLQRLPLGEVMAPAIGAATARAHLANGDPRGARRTLAPLLTEEPAVPLHVQVDLWLIDALAAHALREATQARRSLSRALALAEPDGLRRPFTTAAARLQSLLHRQPDLVTAHPSLLSDLRHPSVNGPQRRSSPSGPYPLLEPLSEREQEVLRYLPTLMSNAEIAATIYLSTNTVKTHLKSIYRKLAAGGRREAVLRAERLQLV